MLTETVDLSYVQLRVWQWSSD